MSSPLFEGGRLRKIPGIEQRIAERLTALGFGEIPTGRGRRKTPAFKAFVQSLRAARRDPPYDERSLAKWARGVNAPEFPMAARLAQDLGVPLSWLLLGPAVFAELRDLAAMARDVQPPIQAGHTEEKQPQPRVRTRVARYSRRAPAAAHGRLSERRRVDSGESRR